MTRPILIRFERQYIWKDLWDRDVRKISLVIWFIFFIASISSTLGLAFPEISDYKRKQHLLENPNSLRLIFAPPFGSNFNDFVKSGVDIPNPLKEKLINGFKPLLASGVIQSIQERSRMSLEWFDDTTTVSVAQSSEIIRTIIRGRVLRAGDPCLEGQNLVNGMVIKDSDSIFGDSGAASIPIVVTKDFFHALWGNRKERDKNPDFFVTKNLQFVFRGQDEGFPCTIKGILRDEQPTDGEFFIRMEDLQPKIVKVLEENRLVKSIIIGGVEGKSLRSPAAQKVLDEFGIRSPFSVPEGDETLYRLAFADQIRSEKIAFWEKTILGKIRKELPNGEQVVIKKRTFAEEKFGTLPGKSDCDGIVVHSADLGGLPLIHQRFREVFSKGDVNADGSTDEDSIDADKIPKLQNPDIINQISQIDSSTKWNRIAIWTQLAVGSFILVISLSALVSVRLEQKRAEIGLLRMLGISSTRLLWMFIFQSWLLCLLGMAPGIFFALIGLDVIRNFALDFSWAMGCFWIFLFVYSASHFLLLAIGVWLGSRNSLNQSPAKWLNVT